MSSNLRRNLSHLAQVSVRLQTRIPIAVTLNANLCADLARRYSPDQTGSLDHSIVVEPANAGLVVHAQAQATSDHAVPIEYGNRHNLPHPFWRPAVRQAQQQGKIAIPRVFMNALK